MSEVSKRWKRVLDIYRANVSVDRPLRGAAGRFAACRWAVVHPDLVLEVTEAVIHTYNLWVEQALEDKKFIAYARITMRRIGGP